MNDSHGLPRASWSNLLASSPLIVGGLKIGATTVGPWSSMAAITDAIAGTNIGAVGLMGFNNSTFDQWRNNLSFAALPSAARTSTTSSAQFRSYNARGIIAILTVTANPGGAETLTLEIDGIINGFTSNICAQTAVLTAGTNSLGECAIGPGLLDTYFDTAPTIKISKQVFVPDVFTVAVRHSAAGSWTYRVDVALMV